MRRSRRPAAVLVAVVCAVATGCGTSGEGAAKDSAAGAGTSVLATVSATATGPAGSGSPGPSASGPVVVASSAAPSALSGLAAYLTAVQRADAALQHAATLVNGDVGSAELRIGPATRDAIRSVDLAAAARELPAGMPAELTRRALLVYSELASRRAAFSGVLAVTTGPDGTATLPATSPDMTRIRGCLANGATANARFRGDLAALRALAASTPGGFERATQHRGYAEVALDGSKGSASKSPGSKPQVEKRAQFVRLIGQGVNNSEACRIVGVNRKTGTRWLHGRSVHNRAGEQVHYPPVVTITEPRPLSPRFLSLQERTTIADLHRAGDSVRAIARELGRPASTVSRELRRNRDDEGRYRPHAADAAARARRRRPRPRRLAADPVLHEAVEAMLTGKWSPEQIAHELRCRFPDQPARWLCPESIYQAVYDPATPLTRPARTALRTRRRRRRPHPTGQQRRGRLCDMTMIEDRPDEVADRNQPGHWEGDLIMGSQNQTAIATLVERRLRYLMLVHLPHGHTAEHVRDAVTAAFAELPAALRRTLTWDQGKEMALHRDITAATGLQVYFCQAHSPWQRGTNENTNGLLRQYFPKGSDLSQHDADELQRVESELNRRPRKTLGWATPEALLEALLSAPSISECCDHP